MKILKIFLPLLLSCSALPLLAADQANTATGDQVVTQPGFSYHGLTPDIITNYLSDSKTLGYVRITVELMVDNQADLKVLEQHDPLLRDAIIRLLGSKNAEQIKSLTNREELRKECENRVNELLVQETGKKAVRELLFTKFLYQ